MGDVQLLELAIGIIIVKSFFLEHAIRETRCRIVLTPFYWADGTVTTMKMKVCDSIPKK